MDATKETFRRAIQERLAVSDPERLVEQLSGFIRRIVEKEGRTGCVLGNSGGLDSALVAAIAVHALGKENVRLFFLPERDTSRKSRPDAFLAAKWLGIKMKVINIRPILHMAGVYRLEPPANIAPRFGVELYVRAKRRKLEAENGSVLLRMLRGGGGNPEIQRHMAYYGTKNRVRMAVLFLQAEKNNCLVLGTCNRSEKMTGLFVKHGDGACDLNPLDKLYKTQVFELARHMGLPHKIIEKKPIGDLAPGLTDEDSLKLDYPRLDWILAGLELGLQDEMIIKDGITQSDIDYIKDLIAASESMRQSHYTP